MPGSGLLSGIGKVAFWGLSPAKDLLEFLDKAKLRTSTGRKDVNILLAGETDSRHALKTLADNWELLQQNDIHLHVGPQNFYIVESSLEQYARQMLFWTLALQPLSCLGLHEKTTQFMELFGNSFIRPQTKKTLLTLVDELIKMVTNEASRTMFDLTEMKFRERDALVELFRFWRTFCDPNRFSMEQHWTERVIRHLGTRYDSRANVFDWDYNIHLLEKGAKIISASEYKKWRETGIGFAEFDSDYSQPNVTLAAGIPTSGGIRLSYTGDIVTGPFISYGIETEDKSRFEKANDRFKNQAYDVTYHNLSSIFQKISPQETAGDEKSAMDMISLHFISPLTFGRAGLFAKYGAGFFEVAYFGNTMAQQILPPLGRVIAPDAVLLVENVYFVLESRADQSKLFDDKVLELATNACFEAIEVSTEAEVEFPCFLQFLHFGGASVFRSEAKMNFIEANAIADCVGQISKLELEPKDGEVKEVASQDVDCSPKGDTAAKANS